MGDRDDVRSLMTGAAAMILVLLAWELHHHVVVAPVALPTLLFELAEVGLLVGFTVTCTLMILRVRVREMVVATGAMTSLYLLGEFYLGDKPATPWTLLVELLELGFLVGCALSLLASGAESGRAREGTYTMNAGCRALASPTLTRRPRTRRCASTRAS